jgi:hypothetical protein
MKPLKFTGSSEDDLAGFPKEAKGVKQRAKLSRFGVETASNSFHPGM